jgi:hypothetical protein
MCGVHGLSAGEVGELPRVGTLMLVTLCSASSAPTQSPFSSEVLADVSQA